MRDIFRLLFVMMLSGLWPGEVAAQELRFAVSGVVRDAETGRRLPQASITTLGGTEATVTNADGHFTLKTERRPTAIFVSCLGYNAVRVSPGDDLGKELKIRLTPGTITLNELIVSAVNPRDIVNSAISKMRKNYSQDNQLLRCFYRETTQKGKRYIYVAEAVADVFKSGYSRLTGVDRVAIRKGRKLVNTHKADTLGAKIQGGPTLAVELDLVKNTEMLLSFEEMLLYDLRMETPVTIDDRPQFVVAFSPATIADHVLSFGKMYIDRQTLAFTRVEMSLDMSDPIRAASAILVRKPVGVRFKPKELSTVVAYRYDGQECRMHYLHSDVSFYCEWKKKLFASPYHVEAEMVATDILQHDAQPLTAAEAFSSHDSFYDKVTVFADPLFWEDYNIILPSESLEKAIEKLKK